MHGGSLEIALAVSLIFLFGFVETLLSEDPYTICYDILVSLINNLPSSSVSNLPPEPSLDFPSNLPSNTSLNNDASHTPSTDSHDHKTFFQPISFYDDPDDDPMSFGFFDAGSVDLPTDLYDTQSDLNTGFGGSEQTFPGSEQTFAGINEPESFTNSGPPGTMVSGVLEAGEGDGSNKCNVGISSAILEEVMDTVVATAIPPR